jgi:hypothetical protein
VKACARRGIIVVNNTRVYVPLSELGPPKQVWSPPRTQVGVDTHAYGVGGGWTRFRRNDRNSSTLCTYSIIHLRMCSFENPCVIARALEEKRVLSSIRTKKTNKICHLGFSMIEARNFQNYGSWQSLLLPERDKTFSHGHTVSDLHSCLCLVKHYRNYSQDASLHSTNFLTFKEPRNRFQGTDSASLCCLGGPYANPNPIYNRFLALIDCSKIPAQITEKHVNMPVATLQPGILQTIYLQL